MIIMTQNADEVYNLLIKALQPNLSDAFNTVSPDRFIWKADHYWRRKLNKRREWRRESRVKQRKWKRNAG